MSTFVCPHCQHAGGSVITDSRMRPGGVRRRRECLKCRRRYTTYEYAVDLIEQVTKRAGHVQPFDRGKLVYSLQKAAVPPDVIEHVVGEVVAAAQDVRILTTGYIADVVALTLQRAAPVAYLRWISAQRHFTNVRQFLLEAQKLPLAKAAAR